MNDINLETWIAYRMKATFLLFFFEAGSAVLCDLTYSSAKRCMIFNKAAVKGTPGERYAVKLLNGNSFKGGGGKEHGAYF